MPDADIATTVPRPFPFSSSSDRLVPRPTACLAGPPRQFIGRKAFLLLWVAFLAAFLATPVRSGQLAEWVEGLQLADAFATAKDFTADMVASLRERIAAARGGGGGAY